MKNSLQFLLAAVPLSLMSMVSTGYASVNIGGKSTDNTEPYPYISPTPGEFPIIAWGMADETSHEVFQGVVECGFNTVTVLPSKSILSDMMAALNPVAGEDTIKLSLIPNLMGMMNRYQPNQAAGYIDYLLNQYNIHMTDGNKTPVTGWMQEDEPTYYQLDAWSPYFHSIAQHDSTRMMWVNLLGDPKAVQYYRPLETDTIKGLALRDYVETFCEKFRPGVLSYDYYPFVVDKAGADSTIRRGRLDDFYTALQIYSEISKKRDRPFWAFCQCRATCINDDYSPKFGHPAPTEDFLRYEAFNALAFGAQGIEYWGYKEDKDPEKNPDPDAYYALVTKSGKKTPAWYFARNVNQEIKKLSYIFLGAKLKSYYFVGDPRDTAYCDYKMGTMDDAIYVEYNPLGTEKNDKRNKGALVSTLTNNGVNYVIIVNQSPYVNTKLRVWHYHSKYQISHVSTTIDPEKSGNVNNSSVIKPDRLIEDIILPPASYRIYSFRPRTHSLTETFQQ